MYNWLVWPRSQRCAKVSSTVPWMKTLQNEKRGRQINRENSVFLLCWVDFFCKRSALQSTSWLLRISRHLVNTDQPWSRNSQNVGLLRLSGCIHMDVWEFLRLVRISRYPVIANQPLLLGVVERVPKIFGTKIFQKSARRSLRIQLYTWNMFIKYDQSIQQIKRIHQILSNCIHQIWSNCIHQIYKSNMIKVYSKSNCIHQILSNYIHQMYKSNMIKVYSKSNCIHQILSNYIHQIYKSDLYDFVFES